MFINHDDNLLDVTLSTETKATTSQQHDHGISKQQQAEVAAHGAHAPPSTETIHTTTEHPFLTEEVGWVDAQDLKPGEHVRRMDGSLGVVIGVKVVSGEAVRYNLTVAHEHTFIVGIDRWVVHNTGKCIFGLGSDKSPIDLDHIWEEHSEDAYQLARRTGHGASNTFFRNMTRDTVEDLVTRGWQARQKIGILSESYEDGMVVLRHKWRAVVDGLTIEGRYNVTRDIVETAYPKGREIWGLR